MPSCRIPSGATAPPSRRLEQIHRTLFEDATRPHALDDMLFRAARSRITSRSRGGGANAQHQLGGPAADNTNLVR